MVDASLTRKALTGTAWSSLSTTIRQLLSLGAVAVLARRLGPGAYGVMAMAVVVTNFLVNFRDLGTAAAVVQRDSLSDQLLSTLFWFNCLFGVILTVTVLLAATPAAQFFHDSRVTSVLRVMSISFVVTSVGIVQSSLLTREMAFKELAVVEIVSAVGGYAVAIACAFGGLDIWSLVFGSLASSCLATVLYWWFCKWLPSWTFSVEDLRSIQRFSLSLSGFGFMNYFSRNADNAIVARFLGDAAVGNYQMAYNLMLYPIQNISSVVAQVLLPAFAKIKNDNERFQSAYVRSCTLIALITFPVIAGLAVVADPFVHALLGAQWVPAIVVFQILAPVGLIQSLQTTVGQIYVAKGRTDWMFRWGVFGCAVLVPAFLVGVRYGVIGVAAAYCIAYLTLMAVPGFMIPFRLINLPVGVFARALAPQIGITMLMVAVCWVWLRQLEHLLIVDPWSRLITSTLLGAAVYLGALLIFRPPAVKHLEEIIDETHPQLARKILRVFGKA